jgi:hypothetical protein
MIFRLIFSWKSSNPMSQPFVVILDTVATDEAQARMYGRDRLSGFVKSEREPQFELLSITPVEETNGDDQTL